MGKTCFPGHKICLIWSTDGFEADPFSFQDKLWKDSWDRLTGYRREKSWHPAKASESRPMHSWWTFDFLHHRSCRRCWEEEKEETWWSESWREGQNRTCALKSYREYHWWWDTSKRLPKQRVWIDSMWRRSVSESWTSVWILTSGRRWRQASWRNNKSG